MRRVILFFILTHNSKLTTHNFTGARVTTFSFGTASRANVGHAGARSCTPSDRGGDLLLDPLDEAKRGKAIRHRDRVPHGSRA